MCKRLVGRGGVGKSIHARNKRRPGTANRRAEKVYGHASGSIVTWHKMHSCMSQQENWVKGNHTCCHAYM